MNNLQAFTHAEALQLWSRLVAGWAHSLNADGSRTLLAGYPNQADGGGSYEGVTRMLWGLGAWLSQPVRSPVVTWRGESFDLAALTRRAIVNGCDPVSLGYWGFETGRHHDQRTVETGQVAFALWQSRDRIWNTLNESEQTKNYNFLERFARLPVNLNSNWALFWVLNHVCRKALDLPYEASILDDVLGTYLDRVYCGAGWYDDAAQKGTGYFDDYTLWVFGSDVLAWAQVDTDSERRAELLERVRLLMEHVPYFFAANGAYTEFGRSLAYKFARLGAPLWAYKLGVWPHSVGMLRRLVGRHLRWYVDRGAIRADGTLRQSLTAGGSPEICEPYISTGATYWAMQAFGGLWSLPDDDPFWSAEEEPLPAEQGDYVKVFPQPGWILTANEGEVQRFNAGSAKNYGTKYAKFAYGTRNPFNVGLTAGSAAPDNMLSLTNGISYGQRTKNIASAVGEPGWLRILWEQTLNVYTHRIDTIIVIQGEQHLRAHRIQLAGEMKTPLALLEGSSPLGYVPGEMPQLFSTEVGQLAATDTRLTGIFNVRGYDRGSIWQGAPGINSVYPYQVVPVLSVLTVESGQELICLVHDGGWLDPALLALDGISGNWQSDGSFELSWGSLNLSIPPL